MIPTTKERISQTIGPNRIHHVKEASDRIHKLISSDWTQFEQLKTESERVEWLWGVDAVKTELLACTSKLQDLLQAQNVPASDGDGDSVTNQSRWKFRKDAAKALYWKAKGNKAFGSGNNLEALEMYTEALLWVPQESAEMPILYANRSAALFHLGEPQLALDDISFAIGAQYPPHLVHKLHERAGRCLLQLGHQKEAGARIQKAIAACQQSKDPKVNENIDKLKALQETTKKPIKNPQKPQRIPQIPPLTGGPSAYFQNASKKLRMMASPDQGRYMMASQPIHPGDVLVVEKAYVSRITPEYHHRQCAQCFIQIQAPIPCTACSLVSYCSMSCRDAAWNQHHRYECEIEGLLAEAGLSITSAKALRVITNGKSLADVLKWMNLPEFIAPTPNLDSTQSAVYPAGSVHSFLQLVTHSERRTTEDWFQRSIMALFLVSVLKLSPFCPAESMSRAEETALATLISRILQVLQFNAHEVAGWDPTEPKSYFLGGAVFPTLALFNHSCAPAIVRYFINDTVIVQAIRSIGPNEEVTENYGPLYTTMDVGQRRVHLLSQYWFDCKCQPCMENWPQLSAMNSDSLSLRCAACHVPLNNSEDYAEDDDLGFVLNCPSCKQPTNMLKTLKLIEASEEKFMRASNLLQGGDLEGARTIFEQLLKFFDSALVLPFRDYHLCQEGLRKCILPLGNQTTKYW